ncbi:MAG: lipoprotein-releasing ABC transporter ATP-binding protein LolD [Legionellaceae bacterium]|nr:lipoprotein-releasing ABC transporter ATP-binding protein LolD [Legionellaceae bacterium]
MSEVIIKCCDLSKAFTDGNTKIDVLNKVNLNIHFGDRLAIVGPSGSGKSTFLHLLGGLDSPSNGEVLIEGTNWHTLKEKQRCLLRNQKLGFVYQFHHLLPEFTALENVSMPLIVRRVSIKQALNDAKEMLASVGLEKRLDHKPSQLSGGERARVAIARALVHKPACVLADEPTGNLDQATAEKVFELMLDINSQARTSLVIVTHDKSIANKMDNILTLKEGALSSSPG